MKKTERELKTLDIMISRYCRQNHKAEYAEESGLCASCKDLQLYAHKRLKNCPFGEKKSACFKCHIHCYGDDMRRKIKSVMRETRIWMLYRHPILTIRHFMG